MVSILYTTVFVVKRSLDGSYSEGGDFFKVPLTPYRCRTAVCMYVALMSTAPDVERERT